MLKKFKTIEGFSKNEIFNSSPLFSEISKSENYYKRGEYEKSKKCLKKSFELIFSNMNLLNTEINSNRIDKENFNLNFKIFEIFFGLYNNFIILTDKGYTIEEENNQIVYEKINYFFKKFEEICFDFLKKSLEKNKYTRKSKSKKKTGKKMINILKRKTEKFLKEKISEKYENASHLIDNLSNFSNKNDFYFKRPNINSNIVRNTFKPKHEQSSNFIISSSIKLKLPRAQSAKKMSFKLKKSNTTQNEGTKIQASFQNYERDFRVKKNIKIQTNDISFHNKGVQNVTVFTDFTSQTENKIEIFHQKNLSIIPNEKWKIIMVPFGTQTEESKMGTKSIEIQTEEIEFQKSIYCPSIVVNTHRDIEKVDNKGIKLKKTTTLAEKIDPPKRLESPRIMLGDMILANFDPSFSTRTIKPSSKGDMMEKKEIEKNEDFLRRDSLLVQRRPSLMKKMGSMRISVSPQAPQSNKNSNDYENGEIPIRSNQKLPTINIKSSSPLTRKFKKNHTQLLQNDNEEQVQLQENSSFFKRKITRRKTFASMLNPNNKSFNDLGKKMEHFQNEVGYFEFIPSPRVCQLGEKKTEGSIIVESESITNKSEKSSENILEASEPDVDLSKMDMVRRSFQHLSVVKTIKKKSTKSDKANSLNINEEDLNRKATTSLVEELEDSDTDDFEIDDLQLSINSKDDKKENKSQLGKCSLNDSWVDEIEREVEANEDTRTALLFLQQQTKIWLRIFIQVRKWKQFNKRIFSQILTFNDDRYIFLVYYLLKENRIRAELYNLEKAYKPLFYIVSEEDTMKYKEKPLTLYENMIIDVEKRIFEVNGDFEKTHEYVRFDSMSSPDKYASMNDSPDGEKPFNPDYYDNQKTLLMEKRKKFNLINLKTMEDEFDIDVENKSESQ